MADCSCFVCWKEWPLFYHFSLFLPKDHREKIFLNLDLFCSVYMSWPLYYLVTRSFFLSLADCIPLTYAHMHNKSRCSKL